MNKAIDILEKARREAFRVEALGVCDREYLYKTVAYIDEALGELYAREGGSDQDREAVNG
jgi:hypothetical protein